MKIQSFIFGWLIILLNSPALAQDTKIGAKNLNAIVKERSRIDSIQLINAAEFSKKNGIPLLLTTEFFTKRLVGIDDWGNPLFISTDNIEAAITTNVTKLRSGNSLGLNLEGYGMKVGVWDGGKVSHIEYNDRILFTEGSNNDNHATHVTGTIAAAGLNASAKGMAPRSKIISYDFNNALSEMATLAKPDQTSTILSNHSYGFITGWDCTVSPCQWRGSPSVSTTEDYRFGFYSANTREWDRIANNAPYYTMIKSAGNDRSDRGPSGAVNPADCNAGSGYDCIEEQATAKNIITVGAVNPVLDYIDESSVVMSSFSGWGPTDDGRIKPDLVADGVGLLSTTLNDSYGKLSGTSMSSPNVTGSLTLLQELYKKLNGGNFMLSSTLRALAIHTTREAGMSPGPDYSFGWGLLDIEAAAKLLINRDNTNNYVEELVLRNGETYNLALTPQANKKITVTIAWNDPAGTPVAASLDPTNLMLVNDLDMQVVDGQTVVALPWVLNPTVEALGQAAFRGDNFRDNVEKIEFDSPSQKVYTLKINHKRTLAGGSQRFSLIVSYSSANETPQSLYWIGNSGDWNDPTHWSFSSGGSPANITPNLLNRVIIDENSFTSTSTGEISFSSNGQCQSFLGLSSSENVDLKLNSNQLTVAGNLTLADSTYTSRVTPGVINFIGTVSNSSLININKSDLQAVKLVFNGVGFSVKGVGKLGEVNLAAGVLDMSGTNFSIKALNSSTSSSKSLILTNASISNLEKSILSVSENLILQSDSVQFTTANLPVRLSWGDLYLKGTINVISSDAKLEGNNRVTKLKVTGNLKLDGNNQIDNLMVSGGAIISLGDNSNQLFSKKTFLQSNANARIKIQSSSASKLSFNGAYRLCFDYLDIVNVSIDGTASINAGLNSTLTNGQNWFQEDCQNVLVPDFEFKYNCLGAQTQLNDISVGLLNNFLWEVTPSSGVTLSTNTAKSITARFPAIGIYQVKLTVSNSKYARSIQKEIPIIANDIPDNQVILNNLNLFSKEFSTSYQWFKNDVPITGANSRSYPFNGDSGSFTVLLSNLSCNKISPPLLITRLEKDSNPEAISLYPNPATDRIFLTELKGQAHLKVYDLIGQLLIEKEEMESDSSGLDISKLTEGLYIVLIETEGQKLFKRILIKN